MMMRLRIYENHIMRTAGRRIIFKIILASPCTPYLHLSLTPSLLTVLALTLPLHALNLQLFIIIITGLSYLVEDGSQFTVSFARICIS